MATIDKLPFDMVHRILDTVTLHTRSSAHYWAKSLLILSICRLWRVIGCRMVYKCVFFYCGPKYDESSHAKSCCSVSNIVLFEQNKLFHIATHLKIWDNNSNKSNSLFRFIAAQLFSNCDTSQLASILHLLDDAEQHGKSYDSVYFGDKPLTLYVALELSRRLPKVKKAFTQLHIPDEFTTGFINALISRYTYHLEHFIFIAGYFTPPALIPMFLNTHNINFWCNSFTPTIPFQFYSRSLKTVRMGVLNGRINWNWFWCNETSLQFEALKELYLQGNVETYRLGIDIKPKLIEAPANSLMFPKLTILAIEFVILRSNEVECLLRAPLEQLYITGYVDDALWICSQNISRISYLKLKLFSCLHGKADASFIRNTNKIFCHTEGIKTVVCDIQLYYEFDYTGINWPFLTHLIVSGCIQFKSLLDALPFIPNLRILQASMQFATDSEIKGAVEAIRRLCEDNSKPSDSKIDTLKIVYTKKQSSRFLEAVEILRWYLPMLTRIDVKWICSIEN